MPNPLMRRGSMNRGHQPPERPQPIEPIPERVVGVNNPYRGTENHGVPVEHPGYEDPEKWDNTVDADYELPHEDVDPIPVQIVYGDTQRELTRLETNQISLDNQSGTKKLILPRDERRRRWSLLLVGNSTAFVSGSDMVDPNNGRLIVPSTSLEGTATDAVYVYFGDGNNQANGANSGIAAGSKLYISSEKALPLD